MIVMGQKPWIAMLFVVRGTPLSRIWLRLLVVTVVAVAITILHDHFHVFEQGLTTIPFSLIGLALGIFLGFRNNTSYDRFWEGRKLWGRLVNTSRSLTRQITTLIGPRKDGGKLDDASLHTIHRELVHYLVAYVHSFRRHLRDDEALEEAKRFMSSEHYALLTSRTNRPIAILHLLGQRLRELWQDGLIHDLHLPVLERSLTELTDIQGACERIKSTPIPSSYNVLIHRLVAFYVFTLPFGLVAMLHSLTPVVTLLVAYAFLGLDAIGDEIEQPFGTDYNDLPLSALATMIERNIREEIGDTELPELLVPQDGLLQ